MQVVAHVQPTLLPFLVQQFVALGHSIVVGIHHSIVVGHGIVVGRHQMIVFHHAGKVAVCMVFLPGTVAAEQHSKALLPTDLLQKLRH